MDKLKTKICTLQTKELNMLSSLRNLEAQIEAFERRHGLKAFL
jgi:hypothetical protein